MSMFRHGGERTRKLVERLSRRARLTSADLRQAMDARIRKDLTAQRAIVFTDTADFTTRTARDGILHFLMLFDRTVRTLEPVIRKHHGDVVKVEGDSMLLRFLDVASACRAIVDMEAALRRQNRTALRKDAVRFSYGIGWGEVLDLEEDIFGLEVNLASKLGEDLAEPGEALLTPSAALALDEETLRRVEPDTFCTYGGAAVPVHELRLRRRGRGPAPVRRPLPTR
jgi:class 3 adenylate cyclase